MSVLLHSLGACVGLCAFGRCRAKLSAAPFALVHRPRWNERLAEQIHACLAVRLRDATARWPYSFEQTHPSSALMSSTFWRIDSAFDLRISIRLIRGGFGLPLPGGRPREASDSSSCLSVSRDLHIQWGPSYTEFGLASLRKSVVLISSFISCCQDCSQIFILECFLPFLPSFLPFLFPPLLFLHFLPLPFPKPRSIPSNPARGLGSTVSSPAPGCR